jgi:hypothetical protein
MSETIPVIVAVPAEKKGIFGDAASELANVPLERLKANFTDLINNLGATTSTLFSSENALGLKEVEFGVEITAEGGLNLIGTIKTGTAASIKLTFGRSE